MRLMLLVFAALLAACGTGFFLFQELILPAAPVEQAAAAVEAPPATDIYVATVELQVGALIVPGNLKRASMPNRLVTAEMIRSDESGLDLLTGSVVRNSVSKGLPVTRSAIVQPGERGFLAAVLPEGKRAVSIYVSEVAGISGLILPGDRVDVILTYIVAGGMIDSGRDIHASETVLRNLRVLALDQRLGPAPQTDEAKGKFVPPPIARMATLQVTSAEAEMITLATQLGDLSLVLNSVRDGGEPEVADVSDVLGELMEPMLRQGPVNRISNSSEVGRRAMTLDSDVTSLLNRRDAEAGKAADAVPTKDRINHVQVVRGSRTNAVKVDVQPGDVTDAEGAPAQPTAD